MNFTYFSYCDFCKVLNFQNWQKPYLDALELEINKDSVKKNELKQNIKDLRICFLNINYGMSLMPLKKEKW